MDVVGANILACNNFQLSQIVKQLNLIYVSFGCMQP